MKLLAAFYLVCTLMDWFTWLMGRLAINRLALICYDKNVVLVNSNLGGFYMLFLSLEYYMYALFMWYIFYQIPKRCGQVSHLTVDHVGLDPTIS